MTQPKLLPAFTPAEFETAHRLLAAKVAYMMGRKFEEGDWAHVYCTAKGIPNTGWSNLNIDVVHHCVGIEHKMLRPNGNRAVRNVFGTRLMHPSASRSIRIEDGPPNIVMSSVLDQYAGLIEERRRYVQQTCPDQIPELRTGWLLWQTNLREFIYFEEETLIPAPDDFTADWHENEEKGARKASKSLWIYEKATGQKKYSVTTTAGAKIQPYFDVPPENSPYVYLFRVQGEEFRPGLVRIWVPASTASELERIVGSLEMARLDNVISSSNLELAERRVGYSVNLEEATELVISSDSYALLEERFPGAVSDSHLIQLLVTELSDR